MSFYVRNNGSPYVTLNNQSNLRTNDISHSKLSKIVTQQLSNAQGKSVSKTNKDRFFAIRAFTLRPLALPQAGIKKSPKKNKRVRSSFIANRTISRGREVNHQHQFKFEPKSCADFIEVDSLYDRVQDHAYRRLQIFYHQCVAYHEEKCIISIGHTSLQHGVSNCEECCAAHSSLLTNLTDNIMQKMREKILSNGLTKGICERVHSLGISNEKISSWKQKNITAKNVDEFLKGIPETTWEGLLSQGSQFYDIMNSTVEVPVLVNIYDCVIERIMRPKALEILNKVSLGLLGPYAAVKNLETEFTDFFKNSYNETVQKIEIFKKVQSWEEKLQELEDDVLLNNVKVTKEWLIDYLSILRNIRRCKNSLENLKNYSLHFKEDWSNYKPMSVLEGVLQLQNNESRTIEYIENMQELDQYINSRKPAFSSLAKQNKDWQQSLDALLKEKRFYEKKVKLQNFLDSCDPIEFALCDQAVLAQVFNCLIETIFSALDRTFYASQARLDKLHDCLQIIDLQSNASVSPPWEVISGNIGGKSLHSLKLEIWNRK